MGTHKRDAQSTFKAYSFGETRTLARYMGQVHQPPRPPWRRRAGGGWKLVVSLAYSVGNIHSPRRGCGTGTQDDVDGSVHVL